MLAEPITQTRAALGELEGLEGMWVKANTPLTSAFGGMEGVADER
jgi:hypothetical protein